MKPTGASPYPNTVEEATTAIAAGKPVIVADDPNHENEVDSIVTIADLKAHRQAGGNKEGSHE